MNIELAKFKELSELFYQINMIFSELEVEIYTTSDVQPRLEKSLAGMSRWIIRYPDDMLTGLIGEIISVGDIFLDRLNTNTMFDWPERVRYLDRWATAISTLDTVLYYFNPVE